MVDSATSTAQRFPFLALGDAALMVEFGNSIDPDVNAHVIAFAETIRAQRWHGVLDVVPTYCSVAIHVDPLVLNVATLMDRLRHISDAESPQKQSSARHHTIPVLYGGEFGGPRRRRRLCQAACSQSHPIARLNSVPRVHDWV